VEEGVGRYLEKCLEYEEWKRELADILQNVWDMKGGKGS
jgi:hypothetical protein